MLKTNTDRMNIKLSIKDQRKKKKELDKILYISLTDSKGIISNPPGSILNRYIFDNRSS